MINDTMHIIIICANNDLNPGNKALEECVDSHRLAYSYYRKGAREKMVVTKSIIDAMKSNGRKFLQWKEDTWIEADENSFPTAS